MATSGQWVQWATLNRKPIRNAPLRLEPAALAGSFFAEIFLGFIVFLHVSGFRQCLGFSDFWVLVLLPSHFFALTPCLRVSVVIIGLCCVLRYAVSPCLRSGFCG